MKGLILLFLSVVAFVVGWQYMDKESKQSIKGIFSKNIAAVLLASLAVAAAVFFSMNTTLRLV